MFRTYLGVLYRLALFSWVFWAASASAVDFSGPALFTQAGPSLSSLGVRLPGGDVDLLVSGTGNGFLSLNEYNPSGRFYSILNKRYIGGEIVEIIAWAGKSAQQPGIVVATANPDRILFIEVNESHPNLDVIAELGLPEDPGGMVFVGHVQTGPWELAVSLPGIDRILFFTDDGDGWREYDDVATGDNPSSVVSIDLDGDQVRELVVAQTGPLSGSLGTFTRQPDASYAMQTIDLPGVLPALVSSFDISTNGRDELAVARSDAKQVVFYETSSGSLVEVGRTELSIAAESMQIATLPGDLPGLFVASGERGLVEVSTYDAGLWSRLGTYYPGCRPHNLTLADLNGDGILDLVAQDEPGQVFSSMIGTGSPGFSGFPAVSLDQTPGSFVSKDIDGDGLHDLLVANVNFSALSLFVGMPDGALSLTPRSLELGFIPGYIRSTNMDADSDLELVVVDILSSEIVVMDYDEAAGFTTLSRTAAGSYPFYIDTADLDGDHKMDLIVLTRDDQEVRALYGNGDGTIFETVALGFGLPAVRVLPVDLNADNQLDMIATDGSNRVWYRLNIDGRQFGPENFVNAGQGAFYMAAGDLDGDQDDDLVVSNRVEETLSFFENTGDGVLTRRIGGHAVNGIPAGVVLADFDADGRQDVVMNHENTGTLSMVLGIEDWSYSLASVFTGGPAVMGIDVVDFNLDGVLDILALDQSLQLGLLLLNGDQEQVAVAPSAVVSECSEDQLQIRVLPDRVGPWTLELGQDGRWWSVMDNGHAALGAVEYDRGTWTVVLSADQVKQVPMATRKPAQVRLSIGQGADRESEVWSVDLGCLKHDNTALPSLLWRAEPWPNPFNPRVQAQFSLGKAGLVLASIYDLAGRCVATLADGQYGAGDHVLRWDGQGEGGPVGAGVYFLRVETTESVLSHKLMLVK